MSVLWASLLTVLLSGAAAQVPEISSGTAKHGDARASSVPSLGYLGLFAASPESVDLVLAYQDIEAAECNVANTPHDYRSLVYHSAAILHVVIFNH